MNEYSIEFDFDDVNGPSPDDPVVLVGVRYTVGGEDIIPSGKSGTSYKNDYLPMALRQWLNCIQVLDHGEEHTFEFAEYSDVQFQMNPRGEYVDLSVTKRHQDEIIESHKLCIDQLARECVDATERYIDWLFDQQPSLASNSSIENLEELATNVEGNVTDGRDGR